MASIHFTHISPSRAIHGHGEPDSSLDDADFVRRHSHLAQFRGDIKSSLLRNCTHGSRCLISTTVGLHHHGTEHVCQTTHR